MSLNLLIRLDCSRDLGGPPQKASSSSSSSSSSSMVAFFLLLRRAGVEGKLWGVVAPSDWGVADLDLGSISPTPVQTSTRHLAHVDQKVTSYLIRPCLYKKLKEKSSNMKFSLIKK